MDCNKLIRSGGIVVGSVKILKIFKNSFYMKVDYCSVVF